MRIYILRRLAEAVPTILMITLVVFVMMRSIPGDPVVALLGDAFTEEDAAKVRTEYGLDKPILVQYGLWLAKAIPAAIIGALRQNTWSDYSATTIAMIGVSIPEFFAGVLLLLVFSVGLHGTLPSSGWVYLPGTCPMVVCTGSVWANMMHVVMPAVALGIGRAALLTRLLRASMLEVIRTEYITTARAKGLAEKPVVLKHALKNALIPTVTV